MHSVFQIAVFNVKSKSQLTTRKGTKKYRGGAGVASSKLSKRSHVATPGKALVTPPRPIMIANRHHQLKMKMMQDWAHKDNAFSHLHLLYTPSLHIFGIHALFRPKSWTAMILTDHFNKIEQHYIG